MKDIKLDGTLIRVPSYGINTLPPCDSQRTGEIVFHVDHSALLICNQTKWMNFEQAYVRKEHLTGSDYILLVLIGFFFAFVIGKVFKVIA